MIIKFTKTLELIKNIIPFTTLFSIIYFLISKFIQLPIDTDIILFIAIIIGIIPLAIDIIETIFIKRFGVDLIALVSITGSLLLGEYMAGIIILLMLSGGEYLENYALRRSKKELNNLLSLVPRFANVRIGDDLKVKKVELVKLNEEVVIKPGEIVPLDGVIIEGSSEFDESTITGESLPTTKSVGDTILSGIVNKDTVVVIRVINEAKDSKYQQIIELVKQAEKERAPFVRMADRYSVWFTILTFSLALATWFVTNDPIRSLTVLVVATPCPLILATPIAFASGISKSAGRGIIVKSGSILEILSRSKTFVFDKTGTLTEGSPKIQEIKTYTKHLNEREVLEIVASLEQYSTHVLAQGFISKANELTIKLLEVENFKEQFGKGVEGTIQGRKYRLGNYEYVLEGVSLNKQIEKDDYGEIFVYLSDRVGGKVLAKFVLKDKLRAETKRELLRLKSLGVSKLFMLTGDKEKIALEIARKVKIDSIFAEVSPKSKMEKIEEIKNLGNVPVTMIGDGINDSPALAQSDIGIAFGVLGTSATTDAGDIIITGNNFDRISYVYELSQKVVLIARQGIFAGMGLSLALMFAGSFGLFTPVIGALLQEIIDFLVILNALRVKVQTK